MEDLLKVLNILVKYSKADLPTHCEHDELWFSTVEKDKVSKEDIRKLDKLGVFWSESDETFKSFRFGSN